MGAAAPLLITFGLSPPAPDLPGPDVPFEVAVEATVAGAVVHGEPATFIGRQLVLTALAERATIGFDAERTLVSPSGWVGRIRVVGDEAWWWERTGWVPELLPVPDDLQQAMGDARIRGPWATRELRVLWTSFQRLSPSEQQRLQGSVYRRRRGRATQRGRVTDGAFRDKLTLFDGAFDDMGDAAADSVFFSAGTVEAPATNEQFIVTHELGHLVDASADDALERSSAPASPEGRECLRQARADVDALPSRRMGDLPDDPGALTGYSRFHPGKNALGEDFAETFALFHLHPTFLQEQAPHRYAWLLAEGHLATPECLTSWVGDAARGPVPPAPL